MVVAVIIVVIVINIDDIEKYAVRVEFFLFICSMPGREGLDYILEKLM